MSPNCIVMSAATYKSCSCCAVKQAKELHHQLEYVNTHQRCEVQMAKLKLEACQQELIESRASKRMELDGMNAEAQDSVANLKTAKQELKMV